MSASQLAIHAEAKRKAAKSDGYKTEQPCDQPTPDPQDAADYPDEPRQCVCGWLISSHQ